jgi:enterochelin esterase-like enzyme
MRLLALLAILLASPAVAAPVRLTEGATVAADLHPDKPDRYAIEAAKGAFVHGFVEQDAVEVHIQLRDPTGKVLRGYDGVSRGKRRFGFVAAVAGTYALVLSTREPTPTGAYRVMLEADVAAPAVQVGPENATLKNVAAGRLDTATFWSRVTATPLIEPRENGDFRVTFLWRGDAQSVRLLWALKRDEAMLQRLDGTDVWYRSETLPRGTRFTYRLAPDAPTGRGGVSAVAQVDPLNSRRFQESDEDDIYSVASVTELPGAAPQPWIEPTDAPKGKVERMRFVSTRMASDREIAIYTPPGYRRDGPALPLVVLFDEEAYVRRIPTPTILDNLIAAGKIPPTIAVLVGNSSEDNRLVELVANPAFKSLVAEELIPWVRGRYAVSADPAETVIGGSSMGGFAAAYIALERPDLFGKVLAQSGSFWWSPTRSPFDPAKYDALSEPSWLAHRLAVEPSRPVVFYLDAGAFEGGEAGGILDTTRHIRDVLKARGYVVHYGEFIGGHDYVNWRGTLADGLIALLGDGP